jgi:Ulp1 family protease
MTNQPQSVTTICLPETSFNHSLLSANNYDNLLENIWGSENINEKLSIINSIEVYRYDFMTLREGCWLNDTIISAYLELIVNSSNSRVNKITLFLT